MGSTRVNAYPETAADLSTEESRAKAAKPDIIAPVTRPATAPSSSRSWRSSGWR